MIIGREGRADAGKLDVRACVLRRAIDDDALLVRVRLRAVPDLVHLPVVVGAVAVQLRVAGDVHVLLGLGEHCVADARDGEHVVHLHARQLLQRLAVGNGVDAAANEEVAQHLAGGRILRHLVDAQLVRAGGVFQEEVMEQIEDEVAAGEDVLAGPRQAAGIDRQRVAAAGDEVMGVVLVDVVKQVLDGRLERVVVAVFDDAGLRAVKQGVDGRPDKLDVPEFLGADVGHKLVVRPELRLGLHVHALHEVVVEGRHLTEPAAHQFLDGGGAFGVDLGALGQFNGKFVDTEKHEGFRLEIV